MTHLTDSILATAVVSQPDVFDSHAVIFDLLTHHQAAYILELHAHIAVADPLKTVNAKIGARLLHLPGIVANGKVPSVNVRGQVTENEQWRKTAGSAGGSGS